MDLIPENDVKRILVTGSTTWADRDTIYRALARYPAGTTLITGDTLGADELAISAAVELGLKVQAMHKTAGDAQRHPEAPWKGLNERMLASNIDLVLAFNSDLGKPGLARGTQHAVDLAVLAGISVEVFK